MKKGKDRRRRVKPAECVRSGDLELGEKHATSYTGR